MPILLGFAMLITLAIPQNKVFANNDSIISGENEASKYLVHTTMESDKQAVTIDLELDSKENVNIQMVTLPDEGEVPFLNQNVIYRVTNNGTYVFTLHYTKTENEATAAAKDKSQADEISTVDIKIDISDINNKNEFTSNSIEGSEKSDVTVESNEKKDITSEKNNKIEKPILNDISTIQVSDFDELNKALSDSNVKVVEIMKNIEITESLQITSEKSIIAYTPVSLIRKSDFANGMISITESGILSLSENIIVDGAGINVNSDLYNGSAINVFGEMQLNGAIIKNHVARVVSPVVIQTGGKAIINSGEISNNSKTDGILPLHGGGGVIIQSNAELEMNGGSIHDNVVINYGGGVCVLADGRFILNNGKIFNNKATHSQSSGGGIYAQGRTTFHMHNGEIYSNKAGDGGGIMLGSAYDDEGDKGDFIIEKGIIRDNKAFYTYGGGIFLPSPYNEIKMNNVYIIENQASYGGGLYDCPTGQTELYITNGSAFIDNTATVAGNFLYKVDSENQFYISSRILGGGKQSLFNDFNPRYQSDDTPLEDSEFQHVEGQLLFHNEISQRNKTLAKEQAGLIIEGNSAEMTGGGIANNGSLIIGDKNADKTVSISKFWEGKLTDIPTSIIIDLIRIDGYGNEISLETVELNEGNDWKYSFEELPGEFNYTVKEHEVAGFKTNYETTVNGNIIQIKITNTLEEINKSVTKIWKDNDNQDGIRPDEVNVRLLANGKDFGEVLTLNEENKWSASWSNLPKYESGEAINYTIKELGTIHGYEGKIENDKDGNFILTNTHAVELIDKTVTKIWNDSNNQDGIRPDEVKVQLLANGKDFGEVLTLNEENKWSASWSNLPKYELGKEINYSINEVTIFDGYKSKTEIDKNGDFIITNTHVPESSIIPEKPNEPTKPEIGYTPPNNKAPQTSDITNISLYLLCVSTSIIVISLIYVKKRKLKKKK